MGRSVSPARQWLPRQYTAPPTFEASGLRYTVERKEHGIYHREAALGPDGRVAAELAAEVAFAIGSGHEGQSFLVNRAGYLFQSPISWFTRKGAWRLSPGFERTNEHFNRPITETCLFCHANAAHTEPNTLNRYPPGGLRLEPIGCERCHGPGELHVAARLRGERPAGKDLTIVNPRRLEPELREAVCQQCHLQGEARIARRGHSFYDFRPGLPLQRFVSVYVRPPAQANSRRAVSHVEQMHLSRCFQASAGKLSCTSCHDPHRLPAAAERVAWYRNRCLNCHQEMACGLAPDTRRARNPADSCIDCHMARHDSSNIAHTAVTDHRIVRRPDPGKPEAPPVDIDLVPFHPDRGGVRDGGDRRDLGLALVEMLARPFPEAQRRALARRACELLGPTAAVPPDDVAALEGLGLAQRDDGRAREALATLELALKQAPRRELALGAAARLALDQGQVRQSIAYWERLIEVNPYSWESHGFLAQALAVGRLWPEAVEACRAAVRLNPFDVRVRMLLIDCLVRKGERAEARAEFDALLGLRPPQPERLRQWFDELLRPGR
jgi:cytochrome c-type biogenesis protein CcmH/NrfG